MNFKTSLPPSLYRRVTELFPYRFFTTPKVVRRTGAAVRLDGSWHLQLDATCGKLATLAGKDLLETLARTFNVQLDARGTRAISVAVAAKATANRESYERIVTPSGIRIIAADDEGAMRALFHMRQEMLNARGPILPIGRVQKSPAWELRTTSPVLHHGIDRPRDYLDLPRNYLLNMARYGYNATFLFADWLEFMSPAVAGAMAKTGWKTQLAELEEACQYLGEYGIKLLFHINTLTLPTNHKLFKRDPSMRGAQTWFDGQHCLCSSSPAVIKLYEDAARELFSNAPSLAGAVMLIGGECFLHCFTRPTPKPASGTNCPNCGGKDPAKVISGILNAVVRGGGAVKPDAHFMVWPYSAFSWGDVKTQKRLYDRLDKRASFLSAFEKDDWHSVDGTRSYIFDYCISRPGPSPLYDTLQRHAKKNGLKRFAKTETSQSIEMFYVPRIPIMQQWATRYQKLRDMKLNGLHTTWRFYGFCAQRTDEIVDYFNWTENPKVDQFLLSIAQRDFGVNAAGSVLSAWRKFSDAFARFPYSSGLTGFPYWRGPFYLGPAHPFIFDPLVVSGLSAKFCTPSPGIDEMSSDPAIIESTRELRYFPDLTWTQPFGVESMVKRLTEIDKVWQRGVQLLIKASRRTQGDDRQRLEDELRVAQYIGCMFRTAANLVRFQHLRENITSKPCTPARLKQTCTGAIAILRNEIENSELGLSIVEADRSLGYSATYGYAFDLDMIREKIQHSHKQIKQVIPNYFSQYAFHMFGSYETLKT